MATFGNPCVDNTLISTHDYTVIDLTNPVSEWGTLTAVCIYIGTLGAETGKVKVFRDDGTNYVFIGESAPQTVNDGSNTFSGLNIPIRTGDLIAVYLTGTANLKMQTSGGSYVQKSGDIATDSAKSGWSGNPYIASILATYSPLASNVYVNTSTGNDSNAGDSCVAGHPVQTFGKAYSLLNSGGTIHVCNSGADFSGEIVTLNKSFSITVDGDGNFYMPKAS